jgi:hypothetical protein
MKWELGRKVVVLVLICSSVLLPAQQTLAANLPTAQDAGGSTARTQAVIRDVALQSGGAMRGQVVDAQGQPCPDLTVQIAKAGASSDRLVAVRTDHEGRFQFAGLSGGLHGIQTPHGGALCRLWAANTAPPAAVSDVLLVSGDGPVRGSCEAACDESCNRRCGGFPIMLGPLEWAVIGAGIAAAIAIPLALSHRNDAS